MANEQQSTKALTTNGPASRLQKTLAAWEGSLGKVLPGNHPGLSPERVMGVVMGMAQRDWKLMLCDPNTIVHAMVRAGELGLVPSDTTGECYLIPFEDTKVANRMIELGRMAPGEKYFAANLIVGYRGWLRLAHETGLVKHVEVGIVTKDMQRGVDWEMRAGTTWSSENGFWVRPNPEDGVDMSTPAKLKDHMRFVYAIVHLQTGGCQLATLNYNQLNRRIPFGGITAAAKRGPWGTKADAMAIKTALTAALNLVPSQLLTKARVVDVASDHEHGISSMVKQGPTSEGLVDVSDLMGEVIDVDPQTGELVEDDDTDASKSQKTADDLGAPEQAYVDPNVAVALAERFEAELDMQPDEVRKILPGLPDGCTQDEYNAAVGLFDRKMAAQTKSVDEVVADAKAKAKKK